MRELRVPDLQNKFIAGRKDAKTVIVSQQVVAFEPGNAQWTTAFYATTELDENGRLYGSTTWFDHETGITAGGFHPPAEWHERRKCDDPR